MKRRLSAVLVFAVLAAGLFAGSPSVAGAQTPTCLPATSNFAAPGPYTVQVDAGSITTYYTPVELGTKGCTKHPVVLWGNGTFAFPSFYDGLLRQLASHGFIVAAANTPMAGSGQEILAGIDELTRFNGQNGHRLAGKADLTRIAATGHSQGGGGAINAGKDARVDTIAPLQPWLQTEDGVHGPAIFFAGSLDWIVWPGTVRARYDGVKTRLPTAYAELAGASHFEPIFGGGGYLGPITAWMRWHLMGDTTARRMFVGTGCGLCGNPAWSAYEANSLLQNRP